MRKYCFPEEAVARHTLVKLKKKIIWAWPKLLLLQDFPRPVSRVVCTTEVQAGHTYLHTYPGNTPRAALNYRLLLLSRSSEYKNEARERQVRAFEK